jgi:hypothetical protein
MMLQLDNPIKRLITDSVRDANPFFHCMEFVWMMAGSKDAVWLSQFNKRYMEYSDDGKTVHAGYGHRWREHLGIDQILTAVDLLKKNPQDRRIVLQMWDAKADLGRSGKDFPCNTQIMLRVIKNNELDMLVTNRSNDLIWGALGANIVHMTMLHELLASAAGIPLGRYRVVSNNLHMYTGMPRFEEILVHEPETNFYDVGRKYTPLLYGKETVEDFFSDCEGLVNVGPRISDTRWMEEVGQPMYKIYLQRKAGKAIDLDTINCEHWRTACESWLSRRSPTG